MPQASARARPKRPSEEEVRQRWQALSGSQRQRVLRFEDPGLMESVRTSIWSLYRRQVVEERTGQRARGAPDPDLSVDSALLKEAFDLQWKLETSEEYPDAVLMDVEDQEPLMSVKTASFPGDQLFDRFRRVVPDFVAERSRRQCLHRAYWKRFFGESAELNSVQALEQALAALVEQALWAAAVAPLEEIAADDSSIAVSGATATPAAADAEGSGSGKAKKRNNKKQKKQDVAVDASESCAAATDSASKLTPAAELTSISDAVADGDADAKADATVGTCALDGGIVADAVPADSVVGGGHEVEAPNIDTIAAETNAPVAAPVKDEVAASSVSAAVLDGASAVIDAAAEQSDREAADKRQREHGDSSNVDDAASSVDFSASSKKKRPLVSRAGAGAAAGAGAGAIGLAVSGSSDVAVESPDAPAAAVAPAVQAAAQARTGVSGSGPARRRVEADAKQTAGSSSSSSSVPVAMPAVELNVEMLRSAAAGNSNACDRSMSASRRLARELQTQVASSSATSLRSETPPARAVAQTSQGSRRSRGSGTTSKSSSKSLRSSTEEKAVGNGVPSRSKSIANEERVGDACGVSASPRHASAEKCTARSSLSADAEQNDVCPESGAPNSGPAQEYAFMESAVVSEHYWGSQARSGRQGLFASRSTSSRRDEPKEPEVVETATVRDHYWGCQDHLSRSGLHWCLPSALWSRGRWTRPQKGDPPPRSSAVARVQNTFISVDEIVERTSEVRSAQSLPPSPTRGRLDEYGDLWRR